MSNDNEVRITLRLPKELHARLRQLAAAYHRSLNAQIVMILTEWVARQDHKKEEDD